MQILQRLFEPMSYLLERQARDHLPGGKFYTPQASIWEESQSTVKHNKLPEFFFGQLDFHRFNDAWYYGHILTVVPGFTDWYNVKYDNDEAIYVYKLQEDYEQEDLVIVPQRTDMLNFSPKRSQFRFYLHVTASVDDLHVLTSCFCYIWGYCLKRLKAGNDTLQFFVCLN